MKELGKGGGEDAEPTGVQQLLQRARHLGCGGCLWVLFSLAVLASPPLKLDSFVTGPERKQTAKLEQRWGW